VAGAGAPGAGMDALVGMGPGGDRPEGAEHDRLRELLAARGACFFRELVGLSASRDVSLVDVDATLDALWDLVWAGEVTNDTFAPVRAAVGGGRGRRVSAPRSPERAIVPRRTGPPRRTAFSRPRPRLGTLTVMGPPRAQGRWTLTARDLGAGAAAVDPTLAAHARAAVLLERHGVLTREAVRGEGAPGGFAAVYPVLRAMEEAGRIRRGYFVSGLGGAQFALPGAVDRLRAHRERSGSATLVLAATDPANAFGWALPWPATPGSGRPQRAAGAQVVLMDGMASLYLDKGGHSLTALRDADGTWEAEAIGALVALISDGRFGRLTLERFPDELRPRLEAAGFVPTPKGLAHYG